VGAYEVRLELGDHAEHVEQQPTDRIGRVVQLPPRLKRTPFAAISSAISRASGSERPRRSSFDTTRVSPSGKRREFRAGQAGLD